MAKLSLPNVYIGKGWDCYKWLRLLEISPFNDPVFFYFQLCQPLTVYKEFSHIIWCARDYGKKNCYVFQLFPREGGKKKKEDIVLSSESNSENFTWRNCNLWQSTVNETWCIIRWPFYIMATVLLFQGNPGYDLHKF